MMMELFPSMNFCTSTCEGGSRGWKSGQRVVRSSRKIDTDNVSSCCRLPNCDGIVPSNRLACKYLENEGCEQLRGDLEDLRTICEVAAIAMLMTVSSPSNYFEQRPFEAFEKQQQQQQQKKKQQKRKDTRRSGWHEKEHRAERTAN